MSEENGRGDLPPLVFETGLRAEKVTVGTHKFWLTEASGGATIKYRDATMAAARMQDGKIVGMNGLNESEAILVAECLYDADPQTGAFRLDRSGDPDPRFRVSIARVKAFRGAVLGALFERVKAVSPDLSPAPVTAEGLKKQIAKLQSQLETLEGGTPLPGSEEDVKNAPAGWPATSE